MAIDPVSNLVVAGLHDKIKIWEPDTQEEISELQHTGDIISLAFSQDGTLLATGSTEGTVIMWKSDGTNFLQTGSLLRLNGYARFLAFSPDNKWLAGGGSTSYAYLWDISSSQELARIPHGNPVTSVTFSPDGEKLLTVSRKVVRIWDISIIPKIPRDELIPIACTHITENLSLEDWSVYFIDEEYQPICPNLLFLETGN
jgi:WD40 repeat protein